MVEIMIVLAVSALMILIATTFLAGRQGHTQFSQNMRDLQSKVQSWLDDVPNGFAFGANSDAYCRAVGASVEILASGRSGLANVNPDCIFLGKAIQFNDAPDNYEVNAYSVFGQRADNSGNLFGTLDDSGPEPAAGQCGKCADFTETYTLKDGTHLKKILKSSGIGTDNSHLAGFYLSLNTDKAVGGNGQTDLIGYQYPFTSSTSANDNSVIKCIEDKPPDCQLAAGKKAPDYLSDWQLCFDNTANDDTAVLTITGGNNGLGVATQLEFKPCP
jgi:hypothetical protein